MGDEPTKEHRTWLPLAAAVAAVGLVVVGAGAAVASWWQSTLDDALDRSVTVAHGDAQWEVTPRNLGASPDVEGVVVALREAVRTGTWTRLAGSRWQATGEAGGWHVPLTAPDDELGAYVATLAEDVDHAPRDATIDVPADPSADGWEVAQASTGERLEQRAARQQILDALRVEADEVTLPVEELAPSISTEAAERALPPVRWALEAALDRPIALSYADRDWTVTPRDLGARPDLDPVIDTALDAASRDERVDVDVEVAASTSRVAALVDDIAAEVDRSRRSAEIDVDDLEVRSARTGLEVDRGTAIERLVEAVADRDDEVAVPVDEHAPEVPTDVAERALPAVQEALEQTVSVVHGDSQWQATPRQLGASADVEAAIDAALEDDEPSAEDVGVQVSEGAVAGFVDEIAAEVDRSPRHGAMDWSSGWIDVTEPRDGRAVARGTTVEQLHGALNGGGGGDDTVELPVERVAARSANVPHRVLLLRQNERKLYLYVNGEVSRSWPVAVGQAGSPTPTGEFTVGAKRHRPTWTNPAPNGWGADMPAQVGPGPGNPLGVRALNWNRGGSDTLIRFHGTPETSSIGQAASRGCVRLTNSAVRELYELVPSGTKIVSVHG